MKDENDPNYIINTICKKAEIDGQYAIAFAILKLTLTLEEIAHRLRVAPNNVSNL